MVKHHGIGSAGHAYDGGDGGGRSGSRGHREQRAGATEGVPAVGGRRPGGVGGHFGGGSNVNGDGAISVRHVRRLAFGRVGDVIVAGVDGETRQNSDIAGRRRAGSKEGSAAEIVARGGMVGHRAAGGGAEGRNFRIGRAPGEGRGSQGGIIGDAAQRIDRDGRDGYAGAVVYGDRVSCLVLASDLEVDGLDQAGGEGIRVAADPGGAGNKIGDAGGFGSDRNLVEHVGLACGRDGSCGDHTGIARRPGHGADGAGDVPRDSVVGGGRVDPGLTLREAVILRRLGVAVLNLNAIDGLVDVDGSGRAVDAVDDGVYRSDSGIAATALAASLVPGAGASVPIDVDGEWRGGDSTGRNSHNILNVEAENGLAGGVLAAGAKDLSATHNKGEGVGGAQRNALHASATEVGAAFAEAAGEGDDEGDGQRK